MKTNKEPQTQVIHPDSGSEDSEQEGVDYRVSIKGKGITKANTGDLYQEFKVGIERYIDFKTHGFLHYCVRTDNPWTAMGDENAYLEWMQRVEAAAAKSKQLVVVRVQEHSLLLTFTF